MSVNGWASVVRLGDVVRHRKHFVEIDDLEKYKRCRVQLHAKGIVVRDVVEGALIKTKKQQVCRKDEFLVAEIDAKVGGFGIVPAELDGAIVSSHYFLFELLRDRLNPRYLDYYCRTPQFRDQVSARGSTNYAAIRPTHVLSYTLPLPPLPEQERIVARIDLLNAKIQEANGLRQSASNNSTLVVGNTVKELFIRNWQSWEEGVLGNWIVDDCYGTSEKTHVDPRGIPILRMGNIQNGTLVTDDLRYLDLSEKDRNKWVIETGDILVNRTNSAELVGKCAVFELPGEWGFASYIIRLRIDQNRAHPKLLARYINSPIGREYMFRERKQMTGQANVNAKKLRALPIALPSIDVQRRLVEELDSLQEKVNKIDHLHAKASLELDALLPSILDRAFRGEL